MLTGGIQVIAVQADTSAPARVLLSLLFAPGQRPGAGDIVRLSETEGSFAVSHRPGEGAGWLELLVNGLTFDLSGLSPGEPAANFEFAHRYGVHGEAAADSFEALELRPGPHLAGGESLMPVVRSAAALAAALAALPGVVAIGWRPARALSGVAHYRRAIAAWLGGGPFPALGLAALTRDPDGAMRSEGLKFLIGQELWLGHSNGTQPADDARLAVRLIDLLTASGSIGPGLTVEPEPGCPVRLEADRAAGLVRAWRQAN